jgi:hypothetical protein
MLCSCVYVWCLVHVLLKCSFFTVMGKRKWKKAKKLLDSLLDSSSSCSSSSDQWEDAVLSLCATLHHAASWLQDYSDTVHSNSRSSQTADPANQPQSWQSSSSASWNRHMLLKLFTYMSIQQQSCNNILLFCVIKMQATCELGSCISCSFGQLGGNMQTKHLHQC